MHRIVTRLLLALFATCLISLTQHQAYAGTACQQINPATGECLISVEAPGRGPDPGAHHDPQDTGSGASCYWDPSKQGLAGPPAGPVVCTTSHGRWSNTYNCYVQRDNPQPPAGDPSWKGHQPGDGAVYVCYQPQTDMGFYFWAQNPPASAAAGPSPRQVAQIAIKRMRLRAIDIGIAPRPGPDSIGLVGMPVWMWAKTPHRHTFGPITATASAGGITITATAKVLRVTWDMGDGTRVICDTAGTPYQPKFGRKRSPSCGHVYDKSSVGRAGNAYTVTATSNWVITWSGAGQTGTIRLGGLQRSTRIRIGEAQVLVD